MTQRILVPTDFSPQAKAALSTAVILADKLNAELFILHSIDIHDRFIPRASPDRPQSREELLIQRAEKQMKEHLDSEDIKKRNPTIIIGKDNLLEDVIKACETHAISFITMGSNGSSGLSEILIGSNTERVVRHAKVPVLVIKNQLMDFNQEMPFVFASSLQNKDKSALEKAKITAALLDANLEILYINTQTNFKTTKDIFKLINYFLTEEERENIKVAVHNSVNIETGILEYMEKRQDAIFGIGTNGRKGLARFFNDSIAESLVNHAASSIFCFKIN